jgi:hypothetical protein
MTIRRAAFADVPRLVELLLEGHTRSKYANRCGVDVVLTKQLLVGALQRDGVKGAGGTCCFVAEVDGVVEGMILGATEPVYQIGDRLSATDVFFLVSERSEGSDFLRLLAAFEAWAWTNPKVIEVRLGITDAIGDPERLGAVYERRGYTRCGTMFEKEAAS